MLINKATKPIRLFPQFYNFDVPESWLVYRFEDKLHIMKGLSYTSDDLNESGEVLINLASFSKYGGFNPKGIKYCKNFNRKDNEAHENDLLIANTDVTLAGNIIGYPIKVPNFKNKRIYYSMDVSKISLIDNEVSKEYLYYYLKSDFIHNCMRSFCSGTTVLHLDLNSVRRMKLILPPYDEQQKIASILSNVDNLIQKIDQVIEQTQRLKRGLIQRLLTKGIGHTKFKPVRFGPLFLNYEIPDKWQVTTLKQCVRSDAPITYGIVQAGPHVPGGIPYIRTGDMSGGKLSKENMLCTSQEIATPFQRSKVKSGEIVCALRGIVGKVLQVPEDLEGANLTQGTARISPKHDIHQRYLLWALQSEYAKRQFEVYSKGTTLDEITLEQLRSIKIAIPSDLREQMSLAHILDQIELSIDLSHNYKENVVTLKKGLMQQLLTGKIRVKV